MAYQLTLYVDDSFKQQQIPEIIAKHCMSTPNIIHKSTILLSVTAVNDITAKQLLQDHVNLKHSNESLLRCNASNIESQTLKFPKCV